MAERTASTAPPNSASILSPPVPKIRPSNLPTASGVEHWSLTTLQEKPVKIGAKGVRHGRYVTFQLAEVAVPRHVFREILRRIDELR